MSGREVVLHAADGTTLAATAWEPPREPPGAVLINSATGVKRGYYAPFASFLAARGLLVLTYDQRAAPARGAAGRCAERLLAPLERHHPPRLVGAVALLIPATCAGFGYFPGRVLGSGEDLPAGVAREWARWGRLPRYVADDEGGALAAGYAALALPIRALSFADDGFAPAAAVDALLDLYASADRHHVHLQPHELGRGVGHWGFFRERNRKPLWLDAAGWLEPRLQPAGQRRRDESP